MLLHGSRNHCWPEGEPVPLNPEYIENGIAFWNRRGWSADLHNSFYVKHVPAMRPVDGRFDLDWWNRVWPTLRGWSATRRGGSRTSMTQRAEQQFPTLERLWRDNVSRHISEDIDAVQWSDVSEFAAHVSYIKGVSSPVFTSKLCHFLIPQVFPVVDNWAMGNPYSTYGEYYQTAQSMWRKTDADTKNLLVSRLANLVGPEMDPLFPTACKLVELHLIGKRHWPTGALNRTPEGRRT